MCSSEVLRMRNACVVVGGSCSAAASCAHLFCMLFQGPAADYVVHHDDGQVALAYR